MVLHPIKDTFSITTPLFYVNDVPHLGSAYPTMAADAISRFNRLQGKGVLFITGVDEHGQKIQRTAEALGRSPQEHCDQTVTSFRDLWEKLNIQYDRFIRTTDPRHTAIVEAFFQRVWEQGDIYLAQQQGWYCVSCEEFKEDRELLPDHYCAIHTNRQAEWRDEQNYFFRLSKYQEPLEALYRDRPDFIQPETRRNEVLSFVSQGLRDFSISRVNLDWGIPMPVDPKHTLYVWFDALLGYITALLKPDAEPTLENALSHWWPINLHLIGKDILRFHAVYWPAMQLSAGIPVSNCIFGHGFLTRDGLKMGKSTGNTLDPFALVQQYGADAVRYYFLREIEFGRDGVFSESRFVDLLNAELADDLGNLLNRTLKLAHKNCQGRVPNLSPEQINQDNPLKTLALTLLPEVFSAYDSLAFSRVCDAIINLAKLGNRYINEKAPWSLFKQGNQQTAEEVLYVVLESVRLAAYLLSPIVPDLSTKIYEQLGFNVDFNDQSLIDVTAPYTIHASWGTLPAEQLLGEPDPVFRRLELLESTSS